MLDYQNAKQLTESLAKKEISSVELVNYYIDRINAHDGKINAVINRDFERAKMLAQEADKLIAQGVQKPLLGLPMTVKESFNVKGLVTHWGNPVFKNWQPDFDSLVISRLKDAGAIILGKTNVPFMLMDWQSYNDINGTTNNPWDVSLTCGGSSGGSAAALAMDFTALELGSDLAGSLRVPAHFCGVAAHKPSHDLVPTFGAGPPTAPFSRFKIDLATVGPMARTVTDLTLQLNVIAGPDPETDGRGYQLKLSAPRHQHLRDYRVLMLDTHPFVPTANAIKNAMHELKMNLVKAGVSVKDDIKLFPDLAAIANLYTIFLGAFGSADIPPRLYKKQKLKAKFLRESNQDFFANYLRGETLSYRDWILSARKREKIQQQIRNFFKEFDVVICPVTTTTAFPHNHIPDFDDRKMNVDGKDYYYYNHYVWASIATLCGLPATAFPISYTNRVPIGIQVMGNYLEDLTTLKFAELVEKEFFGGLVTLPN